MRKTSGAFFPNRRVSGGAGEVTDVPDVGTSVSLAGLYEPIMLGMVFGTTITTLLGLLVAAWLQFKKGPTLGL